jgi:hypothetical protein
VLDDGGEDGSMSKGWESLFWTSVASRSRSGFNSPWTFGTASERRLEVDSADVPAPTRTVGADRASSLPFSWAYRRMGSTVKVCAGPMVLTSSPDMNPTVAV